jgi:hypothetical protein
MKPGTLLRIIDDKSVHPDGFFYIFSHSDDEEQDMFDGFNEFDVTDKKVPINDIFMFLGRQTQNELYVLTTHGPGWIYKSIVEKI